MVEKGCFLWKKIVKVHIGNWCALWPSFIVILVELTPPHVDMPKNLKFLTIPLVASRLCIIRKFHIKKSGLIGTAIFQTQMSLP